MTLRNDPTRFAGFLSDDEQAWLAGAGERPRTMAERLPARVAGLVPRAGQGDWVAILRYERVRVIDGAVVRIRGRGRQVLAAPGAVTSVTWVVDGAAHGIGLPPDQLGWLVLHGPAGVLTALALSEWDAGGGAPTSSTAAMRRTGTEAVAAALGLPLDVVTDRAEAGLRLGRVPRDAVVALRARAPTAYVVATAVAIAAVSFGLVLPGLHPQPWAPWVLVLATAATVARRAAVLRAVRRVGWDEPLYVGPPAAGQHPPALGVVDDEVVVCDGTGWEARVPGPRLGGVGAVVVARDEAGLPWALMLLDRDEEVLLTLPAAAWGVAGEVPARLVDALGRAGLVVTGAQIDPPVRAEHGPTYPAPAAAQDGTTGPAPVGWPSVPATAPWRVPPEPIASVLLVVTAAVLLLVLAAGGHWGGGAVTVCAVAGLLLATPFARIVGR